MMNAPITNNGFDMYCFPLGLYLWRMLFVADNSGVPLFFPGFLLFLYGETISNRKAAQFGRTRVCNSLAACRTEGVVTKKVVKHGQFSPISVESDTLPGVALRRGAACPVGLITFQRRQTFRLGKRST